ncbi:hypothetical protein KTN05_00360 [Paracoccus sp. Z118]|uniref:hypothetical protein n=1 Tax=Paracoccus sp. Z118 TaxID=2851017 RepID=UPI001C2B9CC2|nr:hypothetical protein [Paracoccus sp. Z118]MBV0890308.1 hypothetical protein [Paracoccus sp. Z118]
MNDPLDLLEKAGIALAQMDPAKAEALLGRFEEALGAGMIETASVPACRAAIARLAALSEAQRQGVQAAVDGVIAARETAVSLNIYDTTGRIRVEPGSRGQIHKF